MAKIWNFGTEIDEVLEAEIEKAVGEFTKDGFLTISWHNEPEPTVAFYVAEPLDHIECRKTLFDLLVDEVGIYRRGGPDNNDLFYQPDDDEESRKVKLLQALLRAFLDWRQEQQPPPPAPPA